MAVERKFPSVSFLSSFFLIIVAGTAYRVSRVNKKVLQTQMSDILKKMGNKLYTFEKTKRLDCFPSEVSKSKG